MSYRGRFAPSPTGHLHFGSLVSAVASHARARAAGGDWLVRVEDVDRRREVPGSAESILDTLAAFGMLSDAPVLRQSSRTGAYAAAVDTLLEEGHAYPCGCSRKDLPASGVYPGTCAAGLPPGRSARSVRLRVGGEIIAFDDQIQGRVVQDLGEELGDFVIQRADGFHAYHLAVVLDDAAQGVTEVVRGSDLLASTPRQVLLQRRLGLPTPRYAHHPVAVDPDGRKLSKQSADAPVRDHHPMEGLWMAWRFLGQRLPARPDAPSDPAGFWTWAAAHWDLERVPRAATGALPGPSAPPAGSP